MDKERTRAQEKLELRRNARIARQNRAIQQQGRTMSRRLGLGLGAAGVVGTAAALLLMTNSQESQKDTSEASIINQEIERLGIKPSQKERDLWLKEGFGSYTGPAFRTYTEKETEAKRRIEKTISLMQKSENEHLREAGTFLKPLYANNQVQVREGTVAGSGIISTMTVYPEITGDDLAWFLSVWGDEVLRADSLQLAMKFVHEAKHLENGIRDDQKYLSLTAEERYQKQRDRADNIEEYILEESEGYAAAARSYIKQVGLMGARGMRDAGSQDEELAAVYIIGGSDVTSTHWQSHLISNQLKRGLAVRAG